jgi:hypothetical protein
MRYLIIIFLCIKYFNCLSISDRYIYPGAVWNDTDGKSIQAHATGILLDPFDQSYWWY